LQKQVESPLLFTHPFGSTYTQLSISGQASHLESVVVVHAMRRSPAGQTRGVQGSHVTIPGVFA
jgi:hypothetical protein